MPCHRCLSRYWVEIGATLCEGYCVEQFLGSSCILTCNCKGRQLLNLYIDNFYWMGAYFVLWVLVGPGVNKFADRIKIESIRHFKEILLSSSPLYLGPFDDYSSSAVVSPTCCDLVDMG